MPVYLCKTYEEKNKNLWKIPLLSLDKSVWNCYNKVMHNVKLSKNIKYISKEELSYGKKNEDYGR